MLDLAGVVMDNSPFTPSADPADVLKVNPLDNFIADPVIN